jgi:hypothetical protein
MTLTIFQAKFLHIHELVILKTTQNLMPKDKNLEHNF